MRPGDTFRGMAHFEDSTGALADADALPTGVLRRNGVTLAGAAVTVTKVGTGAYTWSVLLDPDDGWVPGDTAIVEISGAVDGIEMAQSISAVIRVHRREGGEAGRPRRGGEQPTVPLITQPLITRGLRPPKLPPRRLTLACRPIQRRRRR